MTLKTLKTEQKISLILDEEFIQYCKLNNIEDMEKLAKETFKRGFDLLKYGSIPEGELTKQDKEKVVKKTPPPPPSREIKEGRMPDPPPKIIEAVPMKSSDGKEALMKMGVRTEKKDLYDE